MAALAFLALPMLSMLTWSVPLPFSVPPPPPHIRTGVASIEDLWDVSRPEIRRSRSTSEVIYPTLYRRFTLCRIGDV